MSVLIMGKPIKKLYFYKRFFKTEPKENQVIVFSPDKSESGFSDAVNKYVRRYYNEISQFVKFINCDFCFIPKELEFVRALLSNTFNDTLRYYNPDAPSSLSTQKLQFDFNLADYLASDGLDAKSLKPGLICYSGKNHDADDRYAFYYLPFADIFYKGMLLNDLPVRQFVLFISDFLKANKGEFISDDDQNLAFGEDLLASLDGYPVHEDSNLGSSHDDDLYETWELYNYLSEREKDRADKKEPSIKADITKPLSNKVSSKDSEAASPKRKRRGIIAKFHLSKRTQSTEHSIDSLEEEIAAAPYIAAASYNEPQSLHYDDPNFADLHFSDDVRDKLNRLQNLVQELRNNGVAGWMLEQLLHPTRELSRLSIRGTRIFLTDYNNMEIKMGPLPKTVFFFYLRHPEGVRFRDLSKHKKELLSIYGILNKKDDWKQAKKSIDDLVDSTKNSINEKVNAVQKAFVSRFDPELAKNYYITGKQSFPKKIIIDRSLVTWDGVMASL